MKSLAFRRSILAILIVGYVIYMMGNGYRQAAQQRAFNKSQESLQDSSNNARR